MNPPTSLAPLHTTIPGDISSAAFFLVASCLLPESKVVVEHVGVNPTRTGILDVLQAMGASITLTHHTMMGGEPVASIEVTARNLQATEVSGGLIPRTIDELPVLALLATQAHGTTIIRDAQELRVKESDRIATVAAELRRMGAQVEERTDGLVITGPTPLRGASTSSHGDHRLAMMLCIAGLIATGETVIDDVECISDSFPGFIPTLAHLAGQEVLA
jgi:3-phosphoshikimate 1-carboxyvinyltransferase